MTTAPQEPNCVRCRAPREPGSIACAACGYVASPPPSPLPYQPTAQYLQPYADPNLQQPMPPVQAPMPYHYPASAAPVVAAKSPGIAVLLSALWLGAGHLYVGQVAAGVCLIIFDFFLVLLSWTVVGLVISVPIWIIAAIVVSILAANAANEFNRRNGIIVR